MAPAYGDLMCGLQIYVAALQMLTHTSASQVPVPLHHVHSF